VIYRMSGIGYWVHLSVSDDILDTELQYQERSGQCHVKLAQKELLHVVERAYFMMMSI
jgi:hypothetical protein